MIKEYLLLAWSLGLFGFFSLNVNESPAPENPSYPTTAAVTDTLPPVPERYGDFVTDPVKNPFNLKDPAAIEQQVDYDPETGLYMITEKIGNFDFRPPAYLTFEEYLEWSRQQEERKYFDRLAGISTDGADAVVDPLSRFNVETSLLDRLFGGTTVDIKPQGGIDLTFGFDVSKVENPILTERQRTQGGFDFDMNIQMNVVGKIGEKLNLTTNYNTNATFDFDNQIKLDYNTDVFGEDDIIKNIEAGNVSLPLQGSLIQGAESLFGLKTELQFGHLYLTAIASQQKSQRENLQLKGGSQVTEFEVKADEYDENRHFFLSHYNRDAFEESLVNLPQIKGLFKIENIEVWITNDRNEVNEVRDIVAFSDLGEPARLVNPDRIPAFQTPRYREICDGRPLPDNEANGLYQRLLDRGTILREIDQSVSILQSGEFGLVQSRDFEKVSARKLNASEFTFHPNLGFISVNINVQPDQVLGIAFQYSYNGQSFKVGELSYNTENVGTDTLNPTPRVLFVKMLKSTTQQTDIPTWDLMMKNVYPIGAFQVNREDFKLDIFYDDPGKGEKRFLPETNLAGKPLLRVFNLDILNVQGDPQPDGVFDYVEGVTINTRNGRIMFPVLEPFGSSLGRQIEDDRLREKYVYQELYDRTIFLAREFPEKNRFTIRGSYKSSVSSEISLGAFNIPQGSVRVTAGGKTLVEGQDYEVDYNIGRVRILNDVYISSGVPVNVSFEDNTLFGFQSKTMIGVRADYRFNDNFNLGATYLHLFERPFTQKVTIGEDPINNRIYGLDLNMNKKAPWLTKIVDAIPFIDTKEESSVAISAETAILKPGHSRAINQNREDKGGVVYIDDFEGSASSFDLRQPANQWFLASIPQNDGGNNNPKFPESALVNRLEAGANRALLNWYRLDPSARNRSTDEQNPYTSLVPQEEVFPNVQLTPDQLPNVQTLDLFYDPSSRGPYNFELPDGYPGYSRGMEFIGDSTLALKDPGTRWGGMMRALNTNDFQSANIEFLEFWMLSPFLDESDPMSPAEDRAGKEGKIYINLGNVSEDILRDSRKFFENGLPSSSNPERRVDTTSWSVVPIAQQITRAFDNGENTRNDQDVGLDGLNNEGERLKFQSYIDKIAAFNIAAAAKIAQDPSNDDFKYFNDESFPAEAGVRERYRFFNNPEGNSRSNQGNSIRQTGTNIPDAEDLNRDNTLNETESYFEYEIPVRFDPINPRAIDVENTPFITDVQESENGERIWYRFRIPLNGPNKKSVGGIRDFRSIRFMRMYMTEFERPVTLRFARLELVRNQWRTYTQDLSSIGIGFDECEVPPVFDVDAVNIEENSSRRPFNYVLPEGIQREQRLGVFNALQNEQSLSARVQNLCDGKDQAVFKNIDLDFRVYERLKMFVHAESFDGIEVPNGALSLFVRVGSDFQNNYYEYEVPLVMSDPKLVADDSPNSSEYKREVWKPENEIDVALDDWINLKLQRNSEGYSATDEYVQLIDLGPDRLPRYHKVKGNPNLGNVKIAMIGIRNPYNADGASYSTEIWVNEFRLTGLDERGGVAGIARMDLQLADFGNLTLSGNFSSIGFGALNQKVQERNRENIVGYDLAASLELGKFFPEAWGVRLPFYGQVSNTTETPEFDPYDEDVLLRDKLNTAEDGAARDSIRSQSRDVVQIKSINFNNVRKERTDNQRTAKPWDVENLSASYSYTQTDRTDPIIAFDREKVYIGGLEYNFSRQVKYLEPFKGIGSPLLKLLSQVNLNPLPNSVGVSTVLDRRMALTRYRFTGLDDKFNTFFNKRFTWDRDYNLVWDLTRSIKFSFSAFNQAVIDEPNETALLEDPLITLADIETIRKDSILNNIRDFGRNKNYRHNLSVSYTLPIRYLPLMDWVTVRTQYQSDYSWSAAALNADSLGNVIQNSQNRQINAELNFASLYNKSGYLRKINGGSNQRPGQRGGPNPASRLPANTAGQGRNAQDDQEKDRGGEPSTVEKVLIRPLLLLRDARFTFTERFRTVIPGFMPQTRLLGMSSGFEAPGLGFVAGLQPDIRNVEPEDYGNPAKDWLYNNRGWISNSVFLNQEVIQEYTQSFDARVNLEPIPSFKVELFLTRNYTENHSQYFKDTTKNNIVDFVHAIPKDIGSMTLSYFSLNTLFQDSREEIVNLFKQFEQNRVIISRRLGEGTHTDEVLGPEGYAFGYGRTQQDVLIPAFLAAYTETDARSIDLDVFKVLPRVNWRVTYDGLARLPLFEDLFESFQVTHGYQSTLTVNSFNTGLDYLRTGGGVNDLNGNFYARLEIPQIAIQEAFSPLLAVSARLKNGMSLNVDYKKARTLGMSFVSNQLSETQTKEIVIGFGYLVNNVNIGIFGGNNRRGSNAPRPGSSAPTTAGNQLRGKDLDINFDFSLRDDVTFNHLLDQNIIEPTRGNYALTIAPSAEYQLNERLALRLFFNYRRNVPKTSAGFPRTDTAGGLVVRFKLN
ncbi:MAG: cell surface protein SprA [Saprospiraceae bacterium]|nr:cell surface protein SprA [Saprospiraceae bacterium]